MQYETIDDTEECENEEDIDKLLTRWEMEPLLVVTILSNVEMQESLDEEDAKGHEGDDDATHFTINLEFKKN